MSSRIELPVNYGVTQLDLAKSKSGKFLCLLLDMFLRSISFVDRLSIRTFLDRFDLGDRALPKPSHVVRTISSSTHVAACSPFSDMSIAVGRISQLTLSPSRIDFNSHVSCFSFIQTPSVLSSSILVVGLVSGDLEVYKINDSGNKLVYRMNLPKKAHAVAVSGKSANRFQVVLSKGKCVLDFDTITVVSGNTDETCSCSVIDLIHQSPIIDCDVLTDESLLATLSSDGRIVVTHMDSGSCVRFNCDTVFETPSRIFWDQVNGHLLVADDRTNQIIDYSWSNGLVGVAARPNHEMIVRGIVPENLHKLNNDVHVNPKCMDLLKNKIVSVSNNDLHVFTKSDPDSMYPISALSPHYVHEKQTHINSNRDVIVGVTLVSSKRVVIACRSEGDRAEYRFRSIDI